MKELEMLHSVGKLITSLLDLDELLTRIVEASVDVTGAEEGYLLLVDEGTGELYLRAEQNLGEEHAQGFRLRVHDSIAGSVVKTGKPVMVTSKEERGLKIKSGYMVKSLLNAPLKVREKVVGVLGVNNKVSDKAFSEDNLHMLSILADYAAIAIENARLFSQLSETKERLNNLIVSSLDAVIAIDQDKKITVFNRRAEEMFGWTAKEMGGRSAARLHVDFDKAQEIHEVVNREGTIAGWEIVLKHKDGTRIPVLLSATLIRDSQGNPIGQAGFMRDLRQANLLEERLRALIRVSQAITGTLELEKVLDLIVGSTVAAFPTAQSGIIHLYDERTDTLRVRAITLGYSAEALEVLNLRVGEGIAGWVFQNQQSLVVNDTRQEPRYKWVEHPEVRAHKSMICVPLRVRGQVIGTLSLNNSDFTGAFQPEDLGLLASFADQAAIAIDNARRMQELEQMRQAAGAMSRAVEPRQALQRIVESAAQILQADSAVIWSYDEVRHSFIPEQLVAVGIPPGELERFREEEPKPGQTAETVMHEGYVTVMDISQPEYNFLGQSTRELLNRIGVQSFQGIVLRVGDERLGVLCANYNRTRTFDKDDEATLRTFASHAALALKNARLMAQMQRTRETAGVIAGVTLQEDLEQTLKTIAQHAQRVLRSDAISLYSYDEATGQFGEWATEVVDARDPDSARRPEKLDPDSAIGTILRLEGPQYYHLTEDHADQDRLLAGSFVHVEGIKAVIGVQLRVGERKVGVMFVNFRSPHRFTSDEIAAIQLFADQAAVAIENARLYERQQQEAEQLAVINQIAAEISSSLDFGKILHTLASELAWIIGVEQCGIALFDERREYGDIVAEYLEAGGVAAKGLRIPLRDNPTIEIVRKTKRPLAVKDAQHDPRMEKVWDIMKQRRTQSIMIVPIVIGDEVIGTIGLDAVGGSREFTEEEKWLAETIAHHAAIAIRNTWQYEELKHTKGLVGARTALAWMGMASSAWRHAVDKHALTIREQVQLLRKDLQRSFPPEDYAKVDKRLDMLGRLTTQILEKPIIPPLSAEEGVVQVAVNELIGERARQLWQSEPYKSAKLHLRLRLDKAATMRTSPEWLRRVFDVLVDNAVEAIADCEMREISIGTREARGGAEIIVSDTGPGMPREVMSKLFLEPIQKPEEAKGLGMGLLMARVIIQTYGGDIRVESTGPSGTTMVIWLPLAAQEAK